MPTLNKKKKEAPKEQKQQIFFYRGQLARFLINTKKNETIERLRECVLDFVDVAASGWTFI